MGIFAALAYGIPLTDKFGRQLKHIPQELFDFASAFDPYGGEYDDEDEEDSPGAEKLPENPPPGIVNVSTAGNEALVLGILVATGRGGLGFSDPAQATAVHQEFLDTLNKLPPEIRQIVDEMNETPCLELMYGPW